MESTRTNFGFDRSLLGLEIELVENGRARARLPIHEPVQNLFGSLHGGAIATLVDHVGTIAIVSADRNHRPGVTIDLNVSYCAAGTLGDTAIIDAEVLKSGRSLSLVEVSLRRQSDGVLMARGRMTKHMGA